MSPFTPQVEDAFGRQQRENQDLDQRRGQNDANVLEGGNKDKIREDVLEVFQADPGGNARPVPARKGMENGRTRRIVAKEEDEGKGRQQEQVQVPGLAELRPEIQGRVHESRKSNCRIGVPAWVKSDGQLHCRHNLGLGCGIKTNIKTGLSKNCVLCSLCARRPTHPVLPDRWGWPRALPTKPEARRNKGRRRPTVSVRGPIYPGCNQRCAGRLRAFPTATGCHYPKRAVPDKAKIPMDAEIAACGQAQACCVDGLCREALWMWSSRQEDSCPSPCPCPSRLPPVVALPVCRLRHRNCLGPCYGIGSALHGQMQSVQCLNT